MVEVRGERLHDESGTTLVELLVVMVLMTVVGTVTTVGIVGGFNAQLDATNVAETLDGMRIATQRVRDSVRGADEVCASSTDTSLVLWTDDDDDGTVANSELDIFELVGPIDDKVFQRRVPTGGGEVQLIRDDIINSTVFQYDTGSATNQPPELVCEDGATLVAGATSLVRSVTVQFTVDHPDPAEPDLDTETIVQVRNAGLLEDPRDPPTAAFTWSCPAGTTTCSFDASGSTDSDGLVVDWQWDFDDLTFDTGETLDHPFAVGDADYDVTLTVVDNDGVSDVITETVHPGTSSGNAAPVASFTFSCTGRSCDFDASGSSDDSGIATYAWDFGDGVTETNTVATATHTYLANDTYVVTLTVTDDDATTPKTGEETQTVTASTAAIRVESISGTGTPVSGSTGTWEATITVQLGFTTAGNPGAGITISGKVKTNGFQNVSCSTDPNGRCPVTVPGIASNKDAEYEVTSVTDSSGSLTYDPGQNNADSIVVSKNSSVSEP